MWLGSDCGRERRASRVGGWRPPPWAAEGPSVRRVPESTSGRARKRSPFGGDVIGYGRRGPVTVRVSGALAGLQQGRRRSFRMVGGCRSHRPQTC